MEIQSDFCGLADEHYAISQACLDEARKAPNWLSTSQAEFERQHGQTIEGGDSDMESGEEEESENEGDGESERSWCQCQVDPDEPVYLQIKEFLRLGKLKRKLHGYQPDHLMIVAAACSQLDLVREHDLCFVFGRMQFRPFDVTAVKMSLRWEQGNLIARMQSDEADASLPAVFSFGTLMHQIKCMEKGARMWLANYRGKTLGNLHIDSLQSVEDAMAAANPGKKHVSDSESGTEERKEFKKRLALMRQLKKSTEPSGKTDAVKHKKKRMQDHQKRTERKKPLAPVSSGSKAVDQDMLLETSWQEAFESDALVAQPSTSSSSKKEKADQKPVAEVDRRPYKEESGHCFVKEASGKARHLGSLLDFVFHFVIL